MSLMIDIINDEAITVVSSFLNFLFGRNISYHFVAKMTSLGLPKWNCSSIYTIFLSSAILYGIFYTFYAIKYRSSFQSDNIATVRIRNC